MFWYLPWSENIKKRACRYLLQRYVGNFLEEKLTLDQLSVDLYNGTGTVYEVSLDCEAINELGESQNWPIQIVDGYMQKISVTIPWSTLLKDDSVVEVHGLSLTVQPKVRAESGSSMLESMWSSMSSSMQLAAECLKEENVEQEAQPVEGIELFAHAIDSILSRVKVKFVDTKIRIEHVPKSSDTGIALEIHIKNIDYLDEAGSEPPPELIDREQTKTFVVATFSCRRIYFEGVSLHTDEFSSKSRTVSRTLVLERSQMAQSTTRRDFDDSNILSELNVQSVTSEVFYETKSNMSSADACSVKDDSEPTDTENTSKSELTPDDEKATVPDPVLVAKLTGRQELYMKIKQSEEASGPKVDFQLTLGSLILFISPRQLHILIELANGMRSPHLQDTSNVPLRGAGAAECKPLRPVDFERIEAQLLSTFTGAVSAGLAPHRGWSGLGFDDSETMEADNFQPLSQPGNPMTDSCQSSVSSASASVTSSVTTLQPRRNRKVPLIDGDPTAEVSHISVKVASCACILLHKDVLVPISMASECVAAAGVKRMQDMAADFFEKLGFFAVTGYGSKDFDLANQTFDKATSHSHLRLISTSLTIEGSEKTTSQGCQTSGHLAAMNMQLRECLYQATSPDAPPTLHAYDLLLFDRDSKGVAESDAYKTSFGGSPDLKATFKQTQKSSWVAGERRLVYPTTDISVTCSSCSVDVDLTLLERITATLYGARPCSQPPGAAPAVAQNQRNIALKCPKIDAILRFPVADLRPGINREFRRVMPDYLRADFTGVEVASGQPTSVQSTPLDISLQASSIDLYYYENEKDIGTHVAKATSDDTINPDLLKGVTSNSPTINLTFLPRKKPRGPFESSSDEDPYEASLSPNPMTQSVNLMDKVTENSSPGPFSSKKVVHHSETAHDKETKADVEELVVPGSEAEMTEFTQHAVGHSDIHLSVNLPILSLQLESKQVYEVLYNRINSNLLLWEPARDPYGVGGSVLCPAHAQHEPSIYPAFSMCKNTQQYESESSSSSEEDDVFYSTYGSKIRSKQLQSKIASEGKANNDFCLTMKVDKGILTIIAPVRDSNKRVVPGQSGETAIVASKLSMCQVAGAGGRPRHALLALRAASATLYHCELTPTQLEKPPLRAFGSTLPSYLMKTIYPSGKGVLVKNEIVKKDLLSLALSVEPHKDLSNYKKVRLALGVEQASWRHRGEGGVAWLTQLLDVVDVLDYPVPGFAPSTVLTELHVHLWDCAQDYRPLYLPIRSVLTMGSLSVSSTVIANTSTSNLRFLAQECALFLMQVPGAQLRPEAPVPQDNEASPDLCKNYVCVIDLGLFELSLRISDKNVSSGPQVDLRACNNEVHVRTCCDSATALGRLLAYVAADGDAAPPAPTHPARASFCADRDELLVGVDEKHQEEIRELSPSEVQQVNDLMEEAMQESPDVSGVEDSNMSSEKEGVEVFFFPDESTSVAKRSSVDSTPDAKLEGQDARTEMAQEAMPTIAQVARDLGDPNAETKKTTTVKPPKQSEGGNTDDEYCIIEGAVSEEDELAAPVARWYGGEPAPFLENHFAVPTAKTDVLKAPKNFPTPVLRYTLREMSVIWHIYGGCDFAPPDEPAPAAKKNVTINDDVTYAYHASTERGAVSVEYEPYESGREARQARVAWRAPRAAGGGPVRPPRQAHAQARAFVPARGGPHRDANTLVQLHLSKVKFQYETYPTSGEYGSMQTLAIGKIEVRDRLASSHINKLLSGYVSEDVPERKHAHMLLVKAVHLRPDPALAAQECCLKISIMPLRFHIDQDTLMFLVGFFSKLGSDENSDEETRSVGGASTESGGGGTGGGSRHGTPTHRPPVMSVARPAVPATPATTPDADTLSLNEHVSCEEPLMENYEAERLVSTNLIQLAEDFQNMSVSSTQQNTDSAAETEPPDDSPIYFRRVVFSPEVPIRLDYVGKRVDLSAGPVAGLLMGLGQLNCSELRLKRLVHRHGILGVERLMRWALQEWLSDIKRHQLPGLLSGIGPMHSLLQLLTGIRDLVWLPVEQWRRDGRLVHGLRRGAASFGARTAVAAIDVTARILHIIQATAETALDMLSPGGARALPAGARGGGAARRRRRMRAPPARQPADIREGVASAYEIVKEGLAESVATVAEARREGVSVARGVGGAACAPLALAAASAHSAHALLGGVRASLLPDRHRHHADKWRHHPDPASTDDRDQSPSPE